MSGLVGIIRKEDEIKKALAELETLRARAATRQRRGRPAYNPGWHLALDMRNIMLMANCVATAALERQESRGGHTRDDYPGMSAGLAQGQPDLRAGGRRDDAHPAAHAEDAR